MSDELGTKNGQSEPAPPMTCDLKSTLRSPSMAGMIA